MEGKLMALGVAMAIMVASASATSRSVAAAAPAAQGLLCHMTQDGLKACEPAVSAQKGLAAAKPSRACCAALAEADLPCLCNFKNKNLGLLKSLKIDPGLATKLPVECKLTPPAKC